MLNYNTEYLSQGIGTGGGAIKQSGVYPLIITGAYLFNSKDTQSQALVLELENIDEEKARLQIWFKDKNGNEVEYNSKHITHLINLLGINPQIVNETRYNDIKKRDELARFLNKMIGTIIEYDGAETYIGNDGNEYTRHNYKLKGFYDINTGKTADEKNNGTEAKSVKYWEEKFKKNIKNKNETSKEKINNSFVEDDTDSSDDFPF